MVIATEILKGLTEKSVKGSGKIPQLAITSVVCIEVKDGTISLTTTDGSTNLIVSDKVNSQENFMAATDSELFAKLVGKTTESKITLELEDKNLKFVGNGAYMLPLILDEEGQQARIPEIPVVGEAYQCKATELKKLLMYNKQCVLKDMSKPILTSYCITGGYAYTFCDSSGCVTKLNIDEKVGALLRPQMVELFDTFSSDDNVNITVTDKTIRLTGKTVTIDSMLMGYNLKDYPSSELQQLVASKDNYPNQITVSKVSLCNALDRLSLFISMEDANAVEFSPSQELQKVVLRNKNAQGVETVDIEKQTETTVVDTLQYVDYKDVKALVDSVKSDTISITYNTSDSLCIKTDGTYMFTTYLITDDDNEAMEDFENAMQEDEELSE